jgi:hypothetical protein
MTTAFTNVWNRLTHVLKIVQEDGGSNENIEEKHGKTHAALDVVVVAADNEGALSAATTDDASNQQQ